MKKGFALLETIIVITFLSVSMLMLYGTFSSMITNSKKNILYDDVSNIYQIYYLKEYLNLNGLKNLMPTDQIKEVTCDDFSFSSCKTLFQELHVHKIYLMKYDVLPNENSNSMFYDYVSSLSNKKEHEYRFVVEFDHGNNYKYASIGIDGDDNE